jgi:RNA polymerase sigma-70 factor (ECF subfamily)
MPPVQLARPSFAAPVPLSAMSDAALAQRLADGDRSSLDAIYRRHAPALRRYARRYVDATLAEDAVHDAVASTQLALLGRRRTVELRPWLFRCVRNACLSELDRAARRSGELPDESVAAGGADCCDLAARNERLSLALRGMAAAPARGARAARHRRPRLRRAGGALRPHRERDRPAGAPGAPQPHRAGGMSTARAGYAHADAVAQILRGYHAAVMPERDDTSSFELKELQEDRLRDEARLARETDQPADARAHRRRADKAAYLRDKLAEAEQADREAGTES